MWYDTRYDMLFWAYPPHDPPTVLANMFKLLEEDSGQRIVWHLSGQSTRSVPKSEAEWVALAREERDPDFGSLGLFLESPSGLSMSLTVDEPMFVRDFDVLSVGFQDECLSGSAAVFGFDSLRSLFIKCIKLYRPFWARVADTDTNLAKAGKLHLSVDVTKVPASLHWFNFFGIDMVERLGGKDKLLRVPAYLVEEVADPPGIVLVLQREPFDYHKGKHRQRWQDVTRYLDLERLHRLYPKVR